MAKSKPQGRKDQNQTAFAVVQQATGEVTPEKESAAQTPGRLGGIKGGPSRANKLTSTERSEIARKAAQARWSKSNKQA